MTVSGARVNIKAEFYSRKRPNVRTGEVSFRPTDMVHVGPKSIDLICTSILMKCDHLNPVHGLQLEPPFSQSSSLILESNVVFPIAFRRGNQLVQPLQDLPAFLHPELRTLKLVALHMCMIICGFPCWAARASPTQKVMGRQLVPTERPDEHFVWHDGRSKRSPIQLRT